MAGFVSVAAPVCVRRWFHNRDAWREDGKLDVIPLIIGP